MSASENSSLEFLSDSSSKNDNCGRKGTSKGMAKKDVKPKMLIVERTEEEYELYRKMFSELSDVLKVQINCTACGKNLNKIVALGSEVSCHPVLLVLMCNKCKKFYGDGDFSVDEDGTVNYCRWCAQGGTLYCCSDCTSAFCKACLRRNLSKVDFNITESDDWKCLMCNCKPIWKNRSICWAVQKYIAEFQRRTKAERFTKLQNLIKREKGIKLRSSRSNRRRSNSGSDVSYSGAIKRQKLYDKGTTKKFTSRENKRDEVKRNKTSNDESDSSNMENEHAKKRLNSYEKSQIDNCSNKNVNRNNLNVHTIIPKVNISKRSSIKMASSDSENSDIFINKNKSRSSNSRNDISNLKGSALHQKGKKDVYKDNADKNRNTIKNDNHKTEKYEYTLEGGSEISNESNGNTSKEREMEYFEGFCNVTQDLKAAKKTCIWISEHLNDIINIGELISNEAKKMLETKVSISKLTKCSQVNRVISNINLLTNLSCKNLRKVKYISNAAHIHWLEKVKSQISAPIGKAKIVNIDKETSTSEEKESKFEEHCIVKSKDGTIQQCLLSDIDGSKLHEKNVKNNSPVLNHETCSQHLDQRNIDNKFEEKEREICNTGSEKIAYDRLDSSSEGNNDIDKSESDEEKVMNHSDGKLTFKEISESSLSENNHLIETDVHLGKNETKKQELDMVNVLSMKQDNDNEATDFIQSVDQKDIEENGNSVSEATDFIQSVYQKDIEENNGNSISEATDFIQSVDQKDIEENNGNSMSETKNKILATDVIISTDSEEPSDSIADDTYLQDDLRLVETKSDLKTFESKKGMVNKNVIVEENISSGDDLQLNSSSPADNTPNNKEIIEELHKCATSKKVKDNNIGSEIKLHVLDSCSNEPFHCAVKEEMNSLPAKQEKSLSQCPEITAKCSDAKRELLESSTDECLSDDMSDVEHMEKPKVNKKSEQKYSYKGKQGRNTNATVKKSNLKLIHNLSASSSIDSDSSSKKSGKKEEFVTDIESCRKCYVLLERLDYNLIEHDRHKDLKDVGKNEVINNIEEILISPAGDCHENLHKTDEEVNNVNEDSENDLKRLLNMSSLKKKNRLVCNSSTKTNSKKKEKKVAEKAVSLLTIHNKIDEETDENGGYSCNQDSDVDIHKSFNALEAKLESKKNKFAKEMLLLLNTTDEETSDDQSNFKNMGKRKNKSKDRIEKEENIKKERDKDETTPESDNSDANKEKEKSKNNWRNNKLLKWKLSETDTSDEERLWKKKKEQYEKNIKEIDSDDPALKPRSKRKKNVINSNSDDEILNATSDSNSSIEVFKLKRKRKHRSEDSDQSFKNSSASDGSTGKKKVKRKRIRKPVSDNSDNSPVELNESQKSEGTPGKGRKNIRRVLKDGNVAEATKQAAREEEDRRKRIAEKQKLYNSLYKEVESETVDKLVLDFDPDTKEEIVQVHEVIVKKLKPHQVRGVKFMWDACFESVEQTKTTKGSGCILAHCMGLGKTFQVITLVHSLLTHKITNMKTVLVVCPLSTVLNWVNEFSVWLKDTAEDQTIEVYEISKFKKNCERLYKLQEWQETGGVMVLGYDMYRNLANPAAKRVRKSILDGFQSTLVDPGPDLIVCDEGHLLKNEDSAISKAMRRIKTLRRIVLTGTPLQNNLAEYHCMVQFVKPNLLGNRKEFNNRFIHPIYNGQFEDSTAHDVRVMKRRAHVLHKMLEASVQRFDYSVLTPFLPPKQEYVISVKLSEVQIKAYQYYLENFSASQGQELDGVLKPKGAKLFSDFQTLQRIWTHPRVMLMNAEKNEKLAERKRLYESDSEGSLKNFIDDGSDESSSTSGNSEVNEVLPKKMTRSQKNQSNNDVEEVSISDAEETTQKQSRWWEQFVSDGDLEDLRLSGKLVLLFSILHESEKIGDKVLVFSQSLYSLNLIEYFLNKIDDSSQRNELDPSLNNHSGSWTFGLDYFRLDGSTSGENRSQWCKVFNKEDNHRARLFLISTRAGGLGINLVSANRVVIFDASWNPSHDVQSIFRIYRFGQKKPCYVYRFLAQGTMEEKIYDRQVSKLSLACRVVDEHQIERHYNMSDLQELYKFNPEQVTKRFTPILPKDRLFADLLREHEQWIVTYHEHDSLLENKQEEELNEEERKAAWEDYENEKKGKVYDQSFVGANLPQLNMKALRDLIWKENPLITEEQLQERVNNVLHYMVQYQTTNHLVGNVADVNTQNHQFNYNEHQETNIMETNPYMQYSYSPYYQQLNNVPAVGNINLLPSNQQLTNVPVISNTSNRVISVDTGKVTVPSASAPRIKVKSFGLMKDLGGINSQVVLPNPYNPSFNVAAWSAENSLPVVQQTSEANKKPASITNKDLADDSIEIID